MDMSYVEVLFPILANPLNSFKRVGYLWTVLNWNEGQVKELYCEPHNTH